jgi:hypothetical protein
VATAEFECFTLAYVLPEFVFWLLSVGEMVMCLVVVCVVMI